jgi:MFS family permease
MSSDVDSAPQAGIAPEWNCVSACPRMSYMLLRSQWRDFAAVTSSVAVLGLGLGSTMPLTALVLNQRGFSSAIIAWMIAASALGGVVGTIASPRMTLRHGRRKVMLACVFLATLSVMPLQYSNSLAVWAASRFVFGLSMAPLFVLGEAWINAIPGDAVRGRIVAIYTTCFTLCQVTGPLLTQFLTHFPQTMFVIAGGIFLLGAPGIALAREDDRSAASSGDTLSSKNSGAGWLAIVRLAPGIIAGAALFAAFDTVVLSFLPLTALENGFSQALALGAVSITFAGDAGLQIVAGACADRFGRARVQSICGVLLCVMLPVLPFVLRIHFLWVIYLFVLGGIAGAIYTLSLVASGEKFHGAALVRTSGLIALTWNMAATAAPLATGIGAYWLGTYAWVAVLWVLAIGFLISENAAAWWPISRLPRGAPGNQPPEGVD